MLLARRPPVSTAIAVAILVGLTSNGFAAGLDYEQTIAALRGAGATLGYANKNVKSPEQRKTVTEVMYFNVTDAKIESLRLMDGLPHLENVDLVFSSFNPAYSKTLLDSVARHTHVLSKLKGFMVNLAPDLPVTDTEICELSKIPMLSQIAITPLETVNITNKALACLKNVHGLRAIILHNTQITDEGLAHISSLNRLEFLVLAGTEISGEGLQHLKEAPLRGLWLTDTMVKDENLKWLPSFKQLEQLRLDGSPIRGSALKYLSELKELRDLRLSRTQINDKALLHLERLSKLETLALYDCDITDAGVPAIANLKGLKHLDVSKTKLSDEGRKRLSESLPGTRIE